MVVLFGVSNKSMTTTVAVMLPWWTLTVVWNKWLDTPYVESALEYVRIVFCVWNNTSIGSIGASLIGFDNCLKLMTIILSLWHFGIVWDLVFIRWIILSEIHHLIHVADGYDIIDLSLWWLWWHWWYIDVAEDDDLVYLII